MKLTVVFIGISLLSALYKMLPSILLSSLSQYIETFIGDDQYGFRRNRSNINQVLCVRQILENKWEYNETVHQPFVDLKKEFDSVRKEILYNILKKIGVPI
jgi:hypothetical protein